MATANRMRALNRLPYDFEDGLKIAGVDVTTLNQIGTANGAGLVGFAPVGGLSSNNVQSAIVELDTEKVGKSELADTEGAAMVGYDSINARTVFDNARPIADYTALRAYTGRASQVRVTSSGLEGFFYWDANDNSSTDNSGTIIVSSNGRRWKRMHNGTINARWFGAKCDYNGTTGTDDTASLQAALNYANDTPSYICVSLPGRALVSDTLIMGSFTTLTGQSIVSSATNKPIVQVSKNQLNRNWKIADISLSYITQQAANSGGNALSLTGPGTASYMFEVNNVTGSNCSSAVAFVQTANASIFMGIINNIFTYNTTSYTVSIEAPNIGAHTTIEIGTVYYQGLLGQEKTTTGALKVNSVNGLTIKNVGCDRSANAYGLISITNCRGSLSSAICEANIMSASSGNAGAIMLSNSQMDIDYICLTSNTVTISGSASFSAVRADSGSNIRIAQLLDNYSAVNDTSSDNYYTFATDATSVIENDKAYATGTSPALSTNEFGTNTVFRTRKINGNQKTRIEGGKIVTFGTAAPTSGTWSVGDRLINTAATLTGTTATQWACVVAGTPGTWAPVSTLVGKGTTAQRPTNPQIGTPYFDTTLAAKGKPIWNAEPPIKSVVTFTATSNPTSAGNFTITLDNGSPLYIPVTLSSTPGSIAAYMRGLYVAGYTIGGTGNDVTFTKDIAKAVAAPTFSENGTGLAATIVLTTQGVSGWVDYSGTEV